MKYLLDRPYPLLRKSIASYIGICFSAAGYYFCNYPLIVMLVPSVALFFVGYHVSHALLNSLFGQHKIAIQTDKSADKDAEHQLKTIKHIKGLLDYPYKTTLKELEAELCKSDPLLSNNAYLSALQIIKDNPLSFYSSDVELAKRALPVQSSRLKK